MILSYLAKKIGKWSRAAVKLNFLFFYEKHCFAWPWNLTNQWPVLINLHWSGRPMEFPFKWPYEWHKICTRNDGKLQYCIKLIFQFKNNAKAKKHKINISENRILPKIYFLFIQQKSTRGLKINKASAMNGHTIIWWVLKLI